MLLTRTNKNVLQGKERSSNQSRMTEAIRRKCQEAQKELASYLQQKSERLSKDAKKLSLAVFCLVASACSVLAVVYSWYAPKPPRASLLEIRFPVHIAPDRGARINSPSILKDSVSRRVQIFQAYMDSLPRTASGRIRYDSILAVRPGLMDSISRLESISIK